MDDALRAALEQFSRRPRVLLALDFDGTLAPLVHDPDDARALPRAAAALTELTAAPGTHVAVVSGRALDRLRHLLAPLDGVGLVGSHGAEIDESAFGTPDGAPAAASALDDADRERLGRLRDAIREIVAGNPGTFLEEKPAAVVLHTRQAERAPALGATAAALTGPALWPGVHALPGKEVVELAVSDVTKGGALRRLRADLGLDAGGVLFAGDDTTDEMGFEALDDDAGDVTVRVGAGPTAARHRVADPAELAELLAELAALRRGGGGVSSSC